MAQTYSLEDVGKHTSEDDLWIVIHNKGVIPVLHDGVYNVSSYLDEHPGGIEILKECAGTDATEAFEDVGHSDRAWDAMESLLVGELAQNQCQEAVKYYHPSYEHVETVHILKKISIQKQLESLSLKGLGLVLTGLLIYVGGDELKKRIAGISLSNISGGFWYGYLSSTATFSMIAMCVGYHFVKALNPGHNFQKYPARKKPSYRVMLKSQSDEREQRVLDARAYRKFPLCKKEELSPDVYRLVFALSSPSTVLGLPTGQHVSVRAEIKGESVSRSYTPVSNDKDRGVIELVVKVYQDGLFTNHLASLNVGDELEFRGPIGTMKYHSGLCKRIGMIAGGTGITPMYQFIRHICEDESDDTIISLLYANNNEEDILLRAQLDDWAQNHPNKFQVSYVLLNHPNGWKYGKGFVTKDMIKEKLPMASPDSKIMLCGPPGMINAMKKNITELGLPTPGAISRPTDQVFVF